MSILRLRSAQVLRLRSAQAQRRLFYNKFWCNEHLWRCLFCSQWLSSYIFNVIAKSCKTETGSAGGQPVRDSMMTDENVNQAEDASP